MTSDQKMTDIDNLLSDFTETIDKWQQANDARYEQMKAQHNALAEAHNALAEAHNAHIDTYNAHIVKHTKDAEHLAHVMHVVNQNAEGQRQQHWLIVGAIALAAFALGRGA